ncbi:hypothetical protein [Neomegalonema sp.]|uniref:META domain-containing protein n=1 Tax=Neomegalonema sp. TaxID=2039713 RepID=UPI002610FF8D|nr:hypothetical protein [Neomegalonema sp.]MDD2866954.1 hypothetical protein [Neomegalonema sp.]
MGGDWARRAGIWTACVWIAGGAGVWGAEPPPPIAPPLPAAPMPVAPMPVAPMPVAPIPGHGPAFSAPGGPRIAGVWRVLPLPGSPLGGEVVFYDRQFEGRAGCGRFFGSYERMDPWFRVREPFLEGRCEMEAQLLERLTQAARLIRRGSVLEFSDSAGRTLLRLSPM